MQQDAVDQALELATRGHPQQGIERLWPLVRSEATRDQALFALAYCFERADNLATAAYLYGWIVAHHPEFNVAASRLGQCRDAVTARGIIEDFEDSGHNTCPCGLLHYRAEFGVCPYCGRRPGEPEPGPLEAEGAGSIQAPENDGEQRTARPLQGSRTKALDRIQGWTKREELGDVGERIQDLARETAQRIKDVAEKEQVKKSLEKLDQVRQEAGKRTKEFMETERVQEASQKARELGDEASEKIRTIAEREDVRKARANIEKWGRETIGRIDQWMKSEKVRAAHSYAHRVLPLPACQHRASCNRGSNRQSGNSSHGIGRTPGNCQG